jgi:threonylcarbamoyladenosine tRNA methylthiotransferase MtaB
MSTDYELPSLGEGGAGGGNLIDTTRPESASLITLGCKLNQLETEAIASRLFKQGETLHSRLSADSSTVIVNTCTVTQTAEQKARRVIRQALRQGARVIVTGCYAKLNPEAILDIDRPAANEGRLRVAGKAELLGTGTLVPVPARTPVSAPAEVPAPDATFAFAPESFSFHSRPGLKIQDGCSNRCTFCRASLARGPSVSLDSALVLERLRALEGAGFSEAVLNGLNLCQYHDKACPDFGSLLLYLLENTEKIRLRLSSLEIDRVSPAFFEALRNRRLRPHFHLSIQSGSDAVLKRMGRRYEAASVFRLAEAIRAASPGPFLAADIIAGFPGETEADFRATLELCRKLGLAWIHAFPYSPRPGTAAWGLDEQVREEVKAERVAQLEDLAWEGRAAYIAQEVGQEVEVVLLGKEVEGGLAALSENNLRILLEGAAKQEGLRARGSRICRLSLPEKSANHLTKKAKFDMIGTIV